MKTLIIDENKRVYKDDFQGIYSINFEKDSNGHWTKKVDYCLRDMCIKDGASMQVGDRGDMDGFVH